MIFRRQTPAIPPEPHQSDIAAWVDWKVRYTTDLGEVLREIAKRIEDLENRLRAPHDPL